MEFSMIIDFKYAKYFLYIENNEFVGFGIKNGKSIPVGKEAIDILNSFKLSKNSQKLGKYNEFDVYYDNNSQLKHYFKNGIEDWEMLLYENFRSAVLEKVYPIGYRLPQYGYRLPQYKTSKESIKDAYFTIIRTAVCTVCVAAVGLIGMKTHFEPIKYADNYIKYTQEITYENAMKTIKEKIYATPYLTDYEKDLLYDEKYLSEIVPYIIKDPSKYVELVGYRLNNIRVSYFKREDYVNIGGYYDELNPNVIRIREDIKNTDYYYHIIKHEFYHMTQFSARGSNNSRLLEAYTEKSNSEFSNYKPVGYSDEINSLMKLSEVVSKEAILEYMYCSNDELLLNELSNYLSKSEIEEFKDSLIYLNPSRLGANKREEINKNRNTKLTNLVSIAYERKYGVSSKFLFDLIDNKIPIASLTVNNRFANNDQKLAVLEKISLEDAYNNGIIQFQDTVDEYSEKFNPDLVEYEHYPLVDDDYYYSDENGGLSGSDYYSRIVDVGQIETLDFKQAIEKGITKKIRYSNATFSYDEYIQRPNAFNIKILDDNYIIRGKDLLYKSREYDVPKFGKDRACFFDEIAQKVNYYSQSIQISESKMYDLGYLKYYMEIPYEEKDKYDESLIMYSNRCFRNELPQNTYFCDENGNKCEEGESDFVISIDKNGKKNMYSYSDGHKFGYTEYQQYCLLNNTREDALEAKENKKYVEVVIDDYIKENYTYTVIDNNTYELAPKLSYINAEEIDSLIEGNITNKLR